MKNKNTGITLISLIITIIVLLILAGVSISMILRDNGILDNATDAAEQSEITNEKEILQKAVVAAMLDNKQSIIEESNLEKELDKEAGVGKTKITDKGGEFEVLFIESNRYYIVDKNGKVSEVKK